MVLRSVRANRYGASHATCTAEPDEGSVALIREYWKRGDGAFAPGAGRHEPGDSAYHLHWERGQPLSAQVGQSLIRAGR